MLVGIVSRETLLGFLPQNIVDDAEREMERIEAEQPQGTLDIEGMIPENEL